MEENPKRKSPKYFQFFAMIATSMLLMYALMYLNSFQILDHARFSQTRLFMTLIMGGAMMIVMMAYMFGRYQNKLANTAVMIGGGLLVLVSIWLVRSQITVSDTDYMKAMIPHHSIAILTSERAQIEDPRVRKLADEIIRAQRSEIQEMESLISDIKLNGILREGDQESRPVPSFSSRK